MVLWDVVKFCYSDTIISEEIVAFTFEVGQHEHGWGWFFQNVGT
jgi:hypothetical protein